MMRHAYVNGLAVRRHLEMDHISLVGVQRPSLCRVAMEKRERKALVMNRYEKLTGAVSRWEWLPR